MARFSASLCGLMVLATVGEAQRVPPRQAAQSPRIDWRITSAPVVTIIVQVPGGTSKGSGFLVDSLGTVVTAAHVIVNALSGVVRRASGEELVIEGVVDIDARLDVAILRVSGFGLPAARLGNSDSAAVGDQLFAVGAPLGLEHTVTDGIFSSERIDEGVRRLQISVPVSPGNSGGPVFSARGDVVGLVVSGIRGGGAENLNFALPINYVRGKLALADRKELRPLAMAVAGLDAVPGPGPGQPNPPGLVNNDLAVDWSAINGFEAYQEYSGENGWKFKGRVSYRVGLGAQGDSILKRSNTSEARVRVAPLRVVDAWADRSRAELRFGRDPSMSSVTERVPRAPDVEYRNFAVEIGGGVASFTNTGSRTSLAAPRGTISTEFLPALIAGLPDSLPAQVFVWVYNPNNGSVRAERIDFSGVIMVQVAVAEAGQCVEYARTRKRPMLAVLATFAVGVQRRTIPVLANRPHLNVDPESMKCVFHPSLLAP